MNTKKYRILIIGIGNTLMSDDGVGIHLIRKLQKKVHEGDDSLKNISLLEVGTSALYYLEAISRAENLILLDAVKGGAQAGSIYHLQEDDFKTDLQMNRDFHGYSVLDVIKLSREITQLPANLIIYGIEPETLSLGEELSRSVKNALPKVIKLIIEEIKTINNKLT